MSLTPLSLPCVAERRMIEDKLGTQNEKDVLLFFSGTRGGKKKTTSFQVDSEKNLPLFSVHGNTTQTCLFVFFFLLKNGGEIVS